jgi:hypothetical protein
MEKADMTVADLITNGGYLNKDEYKKFMIKLIKASELLKLINTGPIKSYSQVLGEVGLNGRVMRPGTSGQALAAADRAKAVTSEVEIHTKLMKGEIMLDDETLEDNIEGGGFKGTIRTMVAEQVALDFDDLAANGDTASADPFYALQDGMIKSATSHTVNAGTNPITKSYLKQSLKTMPGVYHRNKRAQKFLTSELAVVDYRDFLSNRSGNYGDTNLENERPVYYQDRQIVSVPVFPDNLGGGTDSTVALLLDPNVAKWAIWRRVKYETQRDARAGLWYLVVTARAGFGYKKEDAVVKIENILSNP